jgi:uridine kinase
MKPYIVGITGGSGSGKTYVLKRLVEQLGASHICMVSQDNYYKDRSLQPKDHNGIENFDLPESIDLDAFAQDLEQLKQGKTIRRKEYTYNNKAKEAAELVFEPRPIIIVEGIFILHHKHVSEALDLKVFLDVKDHIKLKRRILRDQRERGYDLDDVLYRFENHVMPTYERYIQRHRTEADIVINNNERVDKALDVLVTFLKAQCK